MVETKEAEPASKVKGLLQTNKAAALGLAVLLATGTILGGCGAPANQSGTAGWEIVEDEDDEEDQAGGAGTYYHGGYGGGYYRYSGRPKFESGGKVTWSKPSDKFKSGGYGFIRGGGAAS